jgi:hypothetical protein
MNTYAIQLLLHFQTERTDDTRFEAFIDDLKLLAEKHEITYDDYQSMQLRSVDYNINPCVSCGNLTVNKIDVQAGDENMLPDFWFYVRRGNLLASGLTCDLCQPVVCAT